MGHCYVHFDFVFTLNHVKYEGLQLDKCNLTQLFDSNVVCSFCQSV